MNCNKVFVFYFGGFVMSNTWIADKFFIKPCILNLDQRFEILNIDHWILLEKLSYTHRSNWTVEETKAMA